MDKTHKEIKKNDRKALPKFLLCLVLGALIGGVLGGFSAKYKTDSIVDLLKTGAAFFGLRIAPWLLVAEAVVLPVMCIAQNRAAGKLLDKWDGEDETVSDAVDQRTSLVIWWSNAALIIAFFLMAASYAGGLSMFEEKKNAIVVLIGIAGFVAVLAESIILQQRSMGFMRCLYPEKNVASVYDFKFQEKLEGALDEAEKIMMGQCAFKAYKATNSVCMTLTIALAIGALLLDIGFLPSLAVCIVWLVNQRAYCKEAMRLSKAGNRLM